MQDSAKKIKQILDASGLSSTIAKISDEIFNIYSDPQKLILMGMASRGIPLAHALAENLGKLYGTEIPVGELDATFYRDDFHYRKRMPHVEMRITSMPLSIEGCHIILVDDVLYTGRTVRAALDALMDLGRPRTVKLCVMVDRGHRELPIAADFIGVHVPTQSDEEVRVKVKPIDGEDSVWLVNVGDL
ncbi:MAG: bifunctional pyr operon transcriptional regulator/uracil phosphoribosyltransferase PyrR [Fibrobacter sp.]|nr:bifunctional pyr operon transcriptional regulator/uracil phosphoribosyltransferase PyrR [Fibrobacter sp.]